VASREVRPPDPVLESASAEGRQLSVGSVRFLTPGADGAIAVPAGVSACGVRPPGIGVVACLSHHPRA
jgi:hypothetical protein